MIRAPTAYECNSNAFAVVDGVKCMAAWYPQMGGYRSFCWVEIGRPSPKGDLPCFDVLVWHDGEFPFGDGSQPPSELHHCVAEQFIDFGKRVKTAQRAPWVEYVDKPVEGKTS